MQEGQPLAYFCKSLGPKAAAQFVYEKEAMAILQALKKWRHYFLGNKVIIKSDQQSLKYLGSQRLLEGIQHKLMLKLLEFDYTIEYKKGSDNTARDALSQQFHEDNSPYADTTAVETHLCNAISTLIPAWLTEVAATYTTDNHCLELLQQLALQPKSKPNLTLQSGILR